MTEPVIGPLAGFRSSALGIGLYAEEGFEGRIRNCANLYLTLAKGAARRLQFGSEWVALDAPNDGPHVFAKLDRLNG